MKNSMIKKIATLAVAGMFGATALMGTALGQGCCLTFPPNTILTAAITSYPGYDGANTSYSALFALDVMDGNQPIPTGVYPGFCVDSSHFLPSVQIAIPGTLYSGLLISTCDAAELINIPDHTVVGPPPIVTFETWHNVNYILNHRAGYNFWNVQVAINRLVGGYTVNDPQNPNPPADASQYPPVDTNQVDALLNDMTNNAVTWTNTCGGKVGVIFAIPDPNPQTDPPEYQFIIFEVPCVCVPPTANCVTISSVQGVPITPVTVVGSGGCGGPYTFSATGLPAGLTMSSGGTISGTATTNGFFSYTVTITDSCGTIGTLNCSVTVLTPPKANCVAVSAVQGVAITPVTVVATGGCGDPYSFTATGLPTGLAMSSTGTISGTPTTNGIFNYTVTIKDACGNIGTLNCSVTVLTPPKANCVTVNAVQGTAITPVTVVATGGCGGPYTFSATGLPAGLTMSSGGTISGTPTTNGIFNYTVTIKDACGNKGTLNCSVSVGVCTASVCGNVFMDCNGDGFLTPGFDSGMSNIPVILKNVNGVTVATSKTDAQGSYCFYNLPPGTYTICINQSTNWVQTAGTCTNHWLNSSYQQCWIDKDKYQHWKGGDGVDCWVASDGYTHWKNSTGQDCWKDKYGISHTQNCTYVSCDAPKNNCETFTLTPCQALTGVNFSYKGVVPKPVVCVTGPSKGICGQTCTYTCSVTNTGTACFSACQVTACGKTFNCPALSPGQGCSFPISYQFQWSDYGSFKCQATASCKYSGSSNPCTAQGTCSTSVTLH